MKVAATRVTAVETVRSRLWTGGGLPSKGGVQNDSLVFDLRE